MAVGIRKMKQHNAVMLMLTRVIIGRNGKIGMLLSALLFLCILAVSSTFAQHDPEKEKEERLNRTVPPKNPTPHYKPPKYKLSSRRDAPSQPIDKGRGEQPGIEVPSPTPPRSAASNQPTTVPATSFGAIALDLSSIEADFTDDPELRIFVDGMEMSKKQNDKQFVVNSVPVGAHTLKITHPMIQDFTYDIKVPSAGAKVNYANLEFAVTRHRLIILSEPQAKVCINGECKEMTDEDGVAVFYLSPQDPYKIKIQKDGYLSREEVKFYVTKPEFYLDFRLTKKTP